LTIGRPNEDRRYSRAVVPIKSKISNAYIDFSQMTVSVLAIITDVWREGKKLLVSASTQWALCSERPAARPLFRGSNPQAKVSWIAPAKISILPESGSS
jgi:hypothetical protein